MLFSCGCVLLTFVSLFLLFFQPHAVETDNSADGEQNWYVFEDVFHVHTIDKSPVVLSFVLVKINIWTDQNNLLSTLQTKYQGIVHVVRGLAENQHSLVVV